VREGKDIATFAVDCAIVSSWQIDCGRDVGKGELVKWPSVFNLTSITLLYETVFLSFN